MKNRVKRLISSLLAVFIILSVFAVSASAADPNDYVYRPETSGLQKLAVSISNAFEEKFGISPVSLFDDLMFPYYGEVSVEQLRECRNYYNDTLFADLSALHPDYDQSKFSGAVIAKDDRYGIWRLQDYNTGEWIVGVSGDFPFCRFYGDVPAIDPIEPIESGSNIWVVSSAVKNHTAPISKAILDERCLELNDWGHPCRVVETIKFGGVKYYVIQDYSSVGGANSIYCNSEGYAYVALAEKSATGIEYNYTDNSNNVTAENAQVVDINNGKLNLYDENGIVISMDIANMVYDGSSPSYTVNAYTTVNEGDTYYYTYYTYNITYNITNTYVTYIGSNDAYEKEEYEYYYQLPDGRSSADLTADEIAGMSFEFHDVVNYAKSATDVSVRALYHFDGDTEDSSYFSTQGAFEWTEGASITYMEAPEAFDGTLYLDSTSHVFDITLPSNFGSNDSTIQFRYYQASEPDTVDNIENSLSIGGKSIISWDDQNLYYSSSAVAALPIGTWCEIALVRNSGTLYIFLNGLCVHSASFNSVLNDTITFTFGSNGSRAYSMLDELRVLNFAISEGGTSYTPTNVPHDSNLVLVLPDSAKPIADEYLSFDTTISPVYSFDFMNGDTRVIPYSGYHSNEKRYIYNRSASNIGGFALYSNYSIASYDGYTSLIGGDSKNPLMDVQSSSSLYLYYGSVFFLNDLGNSSSILNGTYTITFVDVNLNRYSLTFDTSQLTSSGTRSYSAYASLGDGSFRYVRGLNSTYSEFLEIRMPSGKSIDIVYLEVVPGSSANTGHEKVTCIYPEEVMQPNTAAVQSTIPVNGYTVGGVRPTLPSKGDCWFPVSENRIQTCYIYTGSMWEEVGCRWYTGSRWIPIYAFDLTTLEDLFDIADASTAIPPIGSESAFWRWWQLQWLDFRKYLDGKFDELIAAITGGSVGPGTDITAPDEEGNSKFSFSDLLGAVVSSVLEVATTVLTEFIGLIADLIKMFIQAVMDFIGGITSVLADAAGHFVTLGDSVAPIGDFVRGIYDAIPDPIEDVLTGSFVVIVAVSVISFLL